MSLDEDSKDIRIFLISALKDLLRTYEMERSYLESDIGLTESRLGFMRQKLRLYDTGAAIARLKMLKLGAKDAGAFDGKS